MRSSPRVISRLRICITSPEFHTSSMRDCVQSQMRWAGRVGERYALYLSVFTLRRFPLWVSSQWPGELCPGAQLPFDIGVRSKLIENRVKMKCADTIALTHPFPRYTSRLWAGISCVALKEGCDFTRKCFYPEPLWLSFGCCRLARSLQHLALKRQHGRRF
jgi:hypothetical protein